MHKKRTFIFKKQRSKFAGADIKNSEKLALEAIDQIENKKYYQDFMYQNLVTNIYCYGICFTKKSCTVAFKDIKK